MKIFIASFCLSALFAATTASPLRGGNQDKRQLNGNSGNGNGNGNSASGAKEGCIEAAHKFRFAYCDALRTADQTAWIAAAPDFLAPGINTVFGIPGSPNVFNNIDEFLEQDTGFISALKALIIGDYNTCVITFGTNTRVLSHDNHKITVAMPNTKALSWNNSPPRPPFSSGGPGRLLEFDEDEYTCVKVNGKWKIESYDDPNTIVIR